MYTDPQTEPRAHSWVSRHFLSFFKVTNVLSRTNKLRTQVPPLPGPGPSYRAISAPVSHPRCTVLPSCAYPAPEDQAAHLPPAPRLHPKAHSGHTTGSGHKHFPKSSLTSRAAVLGWGCPHSGEALTPELQKPRPTQTLHRCAQAHGLTPRQSCITHMRPQDTLACQLIHPAVSHTHTAPDSSGHSSTWSQEPEVACGLWEPLPADLRARQHCRCCSHNHHLVAPSSPLGSLGGWGACEWRGRVPGLGLPSLSNSAPQGHGGWGRAPISFHLGEAPRNCGCIRLRMGSPGQGAGIPNKASLDPATACGRSQARKAAPLLFVPKIHFFSLKTPRPRLLQQQWAAEKGWYSLLLDGLPPFPPGVHAVPRRNHRPGLTEKGSIKLGVLKRPQRPHNSPNQPPRWGRRQGALPPGPTRATPSGPAGMRPSPGLPLLWAASQPPAWLRTHGATLPGDNAAPCSES